MKCICDQYWNPCGFASTQEDLLCDQCRADPEHGYTGDGMLSIARMAGVQP